MSLASSPTRSSVSDDHYYDFDGGDRMRVSKHMNLSGDSSSPEHLAKTSNYWNSEKIDMKVPDRILVMGQGQFVGTAAPPRELVLESTVMPPDPGMIRVLTPPRVITMAEHYFPTVEDDDDEDDLTEKEYPETPQKINKNAKNHHIQNKNMNTTEDWTPVAAINGSGRGLTANEEIIHLRRQVAKLNRRLMAIELDSIQRQQRDKYLLAVGMGYFLIKLVFWLNK